MDYIYDENPVNAAADHLVLAIKDNLSAGKKVLWLLSGGSGIQVVLEVAKKLRDVDLSNLFVTLTDERYGPLDHKNENWKQLVDGGLNLPKAITYRPLIGADRTTSTDAFGAWIMQQMTTCDYKIGLFGIGGDGHTAGVKPHSDAVNATAWADCYTGEDFERITITPFAISQLDEVVVQASGAEKSTVLRQLLHETIDISQQPAQILKTVARCTLYTDNKEL